MDLRKIPGGHLLEGLKTSKRVESYGSGETVTAERRATPKMLAMIGMVGVLALAGCFDDVTPETAQPGDTVKEYTVTCVINGQEKTFGAGEEKLSTATGEHPYIDHHNTSFTIIRKDGSKTDMQFSNAVQCWRTVHIRTFEAPTSDVKGVIGNKLSERRDNLTNSRGSTLG